MAVPDLQVSRHLGTGADAMAIGAEKHRIDEVIVIGVDQSFRQPSRNRLRLRSAARDDGADFALGRLDLYLVPGVEGQLDERGACADIRGNPNRAVEVDPSATSRQFADHLQRRFAGLLRRKRDLGPRIGIARNHAFISS